MCLSNSTLTRGERDRHTQIRTYVLLCGFVVSRLTDLHSFFSVIGSGERGLNSLSWVPIDWDLSVNSKVQADGLVRCLVCIFEILSEDEFHFLTYCLKQESLFLYQYSPII